MDNRLGLGFGMSTRTESIWLTGKAQVIGQIKKESPKIYFNTRDPITPKILSNIYTEGFGTFWMQWKSPHAPKLNKKYRKYNSHCQKNN